MRFTKIAAAVLLTAVLSSCNTQYLGNIKTTVGASDEIVSTPELKNMLQVIPKPKIVIRVTNPPNAVTEADRFNVYINEIEKVFVQKGYTVRDRALLENLMRSGNIDYKGIKDKIDTDLIIDILALNFDNTTVFHTFFNKTTQKEESFATALTYVECGVATLECRVTIVNQGQLGGVFTLRISPFDMSPADFYVDGFRQKMAWVGQEAAGMFPVLRFLITTEEAKRLLTQILAQRLIDFLSSQ
ncbi:MAG: hypothetical protein KJ939_07240 [Nanoarchaeota archaeon]|nr:hypothetical protein [Nanoarchaeota archaeon]